MFEEPIARPFQPFPSPSQMLVANLEIAERVQDLFTFVIIQRLEYSVDAFLNML